MPPKKAAREAVKRHQVTAVRLSVPSSTLCSMCLNALLSVVSALEMHAAILSNPISGGFDTDSMANLLIVCHVLVIVVFIVAYWVTIRRNKTERCGDLQGMGNLSDFRTRQASLNTPQTEEELDVAYQSLPGTASKKLRTSQTKQLHCRLPS